MSTPFDNASDTAVDFFLSRIKTEEALGTHIDAIRLSALWRDSVARAEKVDSYKPTSFFSRDRSTCIKDETWEAFAEKVNRRLGDTSIDEACLRRIFDDAARSAYFGSVAC